MSRWSTFCDAVLDDLTNNVPALRGVIVHRLAPWDPSQLVVEAGERHLAVFPAAEAVEESSPLVTGPGGDLLVDLYRVLYWEDAGVEASRTTPDEEAAEDLLELLESVVDRFYLIANVFLGDTERTHYEGTSMPDRSSSVRWFQLSITARKSLVAS